ncbi:MAG: hypothetical protein IKH28_14120 [Lachnospiraceae bacterium]|nr:hypothetical protein [Lachnospiraceae bacterium]
MNKRWKVLFGALTMSAMLATGCGPNSTPSEPNDSSSASQVESEATVVESATVTENTMVTESSVENSATSQISRNAGKSVSSSGASDVAVDERFATKPADPKTLDALEDILRNSGLPHANYPSASYCVRYFDPAISGDLEIVCYADGEAEIIYGSSYSSMSMEFYRPSGTYFSFCVRGITKDNVNAPAIDAYDVPLEGKDFAEFSKDFIQNSGYYVSSGMYSFVEDLETYEENLNTVFARFAVLSNEAFDELGLTWEDFGIHFGEEYKKYDAKADLLGTDDKTPLLMETQTFTNGISDSTGKTWVETLRDGIKTQAIYNAYEGQEPSSWFAYNEAESNNFVDASDYIQFETYRHEEGCRVYYHSTHIMDNSFSSEDFNMDFEDKDVWVSYEYENDFKATGQVGVVAADTRMGFSLNCTPEEIKDIFTSVDSLKIALAESGYLGEDSQYMTNDEMLADFMSKYKRYMGSIDDGIKTMGTCFADYGIEY